MSISWLLKDNCFNTQPPEGGWVCRDVGGYQVAVSTHSRLKAAGRGPTGNQALRLVSTHSRLKAAG